MAGAGTRLAVHGGYQSHAMEDGLMLLSLSRMGGVGGFCSRRWARLHGTDGETACTAVN